MTSPARTSHAVLRASHIVLRASYVVLLVPPLLALSAPAPRAPAEERDKAPNSVDLRPAFQKWSLAPRVQGGRGTCSAFVVTEALEYLRTYMNDAAWIGPGARTEGPGGN